MAKTRRAGRRAGRRGIVGYVYNPISQALGAVKNTVSATSNTVKRVVGNSIRGADTIGRKVTGRANATLRGLVPRGMKAQTRRRRRN
jgi:hypothetical protein